MSQELKQLKKENKELKQAIVTKQDEIKNLMLKVQKMGQQIADQAKRLRSYEEIFPNE